MTGVSVKPLVLASQAFPAMEDAVFSAQTRVLMLFRLFDPGLKLRSGQVVDALGKAEPQWLDLLEYKLRQGIQVDILVSDFPPVMSTYLHRECWESIGHLKSLKNRLPKDVARNLSIQAAQHSARFGIGARLLFWPLVWRTLQSRIETLNALSEAERQSRLQNAPGLARLTKIKDGKIRPRFTLPTMRPATHHQKMLVCDDDCAFVGGLDLNERRYDTPRHDQPADQSWYDVMCEVRGLDTTPLVHHFETIKEGTATTADPWPATKASMTLGRTLTGPRSGIMTVSPDVYDGSLLDLHLKAISAARTLIYIENQFLRSHQITDALIAQAKATPDLRLVVLLAGAPEEVAFEGQDNIGMRHGEYLQAKQLLRLKETFGERLGLYTLTRTQPAEVDPGVENDRAEAYGAGLIHLHAKVLVVDDRCAVISSANLNDRSFECDTELGLAWTDADGVRSLRSQIIAHHLKYEPADAPRLDDVFDVLKEASMQRKDNGPVHHLAPLELHKIERYGKRVWYLPDYFV